jgi:hypothetical protein
MESQHKSLSEEMLTYEQTEIIRELVNCGLACEACSTACLNESHVAHLTRCIQLTRDCADTCFHASRLIMRKSELADQIALICEEACRICAEECRKHDHEHCLACADDCDSCAEDCHRYYQHGTK